jgi:hypothetical protein
MLKNKILRLKPQNDIVTQSVDPESMDSLIRIDSCFRRNDTIAEFRKGLRK